MNCVERLMSKFSYYYYKQRVIQIRLKLEKTGEYYLIIDNLTKKVKILESNQKHRDLKNEMDNN